MEHAYNHDITESVATQLILSTNQFIVDTYIITVQNKLGKKTVNLMKK